MTYDKAAKLRDTIVRIVRSELNKISPPPRIGEVESIDRMNNEIRVVFPGDDGPLVVKMTPGSQPQASKYDDGVGNAPADLVRIGGKPGAYYLMDVITSASRNLRYDDITGSLSEEVDIITSLGPIVAPTSSPLPTILAGPGAAILTWDSDPNYVYDVYVSETNTVLPSVENLHPEGVGVKPPLWIRTFPDGSELPTSVDQSGKTVSLPVWYCLRARTGRGAGPASAWVSGTAGMIDPAYLSLTVGTLLANNLFAEAASLVDLYVRGDFEANTISAVGQVSFRANNNELATGAKWFLRRGTTSPVSPPVVAPFYTSVAITGTDSAPSPHTGVVDGTNLYAAGGYTGGGAKGQVLVFPLAGGPMSRTGPVTSDSVYGLAKVGTSWYILRAYSSNGTYRVEQWSSDWTTMNSSWQIGTVAGQYNLVMGSDGTNLFFAHREGGASGSVKFREFTPAGVQVGSTMTATGISLTSGQMFRDLKVGNFDLGNKRILLSISGLGVRSFSIATSSIAQSQENWDFASVDCSSMGWNGQNFVHLDLPARKVYSYSRDFWVDNKSKRFASGTWYNSLGQETDQGPRTYFTAIKRARMQITMPAIPAGSVGARVYVGRVPDTASATASTDQISAIAHRLTVNTPIIFIRVVTGLSKRVTYYVRDVTTNAFRVSLSIGGPAVDITSDGTVAFDPGRINMWRVGSGTDSTILSDDPPVFASPSVNPPAVNNYTAGESATILTDDSQYWFDAEGNLKVKSINVGGVEFAAFKRGRTLVTSDANGEAIITHGMGIAPVLVVTQQTTYVGSPMHIMSHPSDYTSTTFKVILRDGINGNLLPGVERQIGWVAYV